MNLAARSLASLLSVACLSTATTAQPPQARTSQPRETSFSITGTVVNSTTGGPVPHCRITATASRVEGANTNNRGGPNNPGGGLAGARRVQQNTADTDDRGHFTLFLPSAGSWSLRASASGYRSQAFDEHEQFSTAVVLTAQAPTYDLLYRLTPDAAITGLILDEAGEPVRQARVAVYSLPSTPDTSSRATSQRSSQTTTDDRGRYEVAGLAPGDYRLSVQAHPWYASGTFIVRSANASNPVPIDDPSLDAVYPVTWFPGTADENAATNLTLHDGETREADIRLLPIPSVHLNIPAALPAAGDSRVGVSSPRIEPVNPAGNFNQLRITFNGSGYEVAGLAPGLYRIQTQTPGDNRPGAFTTIQITANSSRTLDVSSAAVSSIVTIQTDGAAGADSLPLVFVDASNPRNIYRENRGGDFGFPGGGGPGGPGGFGPGGPPIGPGGQVPSGPINFAPQGMLELPLAPSQLSTLQPTLYQTASPQSAQLVEVLQRNGAPQPPGNPRQPAGANGPRGQRERPPRTIELPPGDYFVFQESSSNFFITGLTLGAKDIPGRLITVPNGASTLTVHFGSGRATISGFATLNSKPSIGAMVALVPITFGQPGGIAEIRRDQTNTDGSFDLPSVIPGQYILIAIDHGWNVRWTDPTTLAHYLANGIPLDLRSPSPIKQNLDAQLP